MYRKSFSDVAKLIIKLIAITKTSECVFVILEVKKMFVLKLSNKKIIVIY